MITGFQETLYQFLSNYLGEKNCSPSFSEMTIAMGISPRSKSLITRSLRALNKQGKIVLEKKGRRLLISLSSKGLPLMGRISAGSPIEAIADYQFIDTNEVLQGNNRYALEVKGNSMMDEGILDGDIIICEQSDTAKEGEIAVVLIEGHNVTLKRVSYKEKEKILLVPANSTLKPVAYLSEQIQIQGIYRGLLRIK